MKKETNYGGVINSPVRTWILYVVSKNKESLTISELHRLIGEELKPDKNYNYRAVHNQVVELSKMGFLKLQQKQDKKGKPVEIKAINPEQWSGFVNQFRSVVDGIAEEINKPSKTPK